MRGMQKRITVLEADRPAPSQNIDLDGLSHDDLDRLIVILTKWHPNDEGPLPVDQMPEEELRFLARLKVSG